MQSLLVPCNSSCWIPFCLQTRAFPWKCFSFSGVPSGKLESLSGSCFAFLACTSDGNWSAEQSPGRNSVSRVFGVFCTTLTALCRAGTEAEAWGLSHGWTCKGMWVARRANAQLFLGNFGSWLWFWHKLIASKGRTVQEENPGAWKKGTLFVRGGLKKTLLQISNIQIWT